MITFFCNKDDYSEDELKAFSVKTGTRVVIRGVVVIEDGEVKEFDDEKNRD